MSQAAPMILPFNVGTKSGKQLRQAALSCARTWRKLGKKAYREGYVDAQRTVGLAFQIGILRERRGLTEEELAGKCGWSVDRQIEIETVGGDELTWETLQVLAAALDIGIMVRFASFSEMVAEEENFDSNLFDVPSFNRDGLGGPKYLRSVQSESNELKGASMAAEKKVVYRTCGSRTINSKRTSDELRRSATRRRSGSVPSYTTSRRK